MKLFEKVKAEFKQYKKIYIGIMIVTMIFLFTFIFQVGVQAEDLEVIEVSEGDYIHAIFESYSYIYNESDNNIDTVLNLLSDDGMIYTFYWHIETDDLMDYARYDYYFQFDSMGQFEWMNIECDDVLIEDY